MSKYSLSSSTKSNVELLTLFNKHNATHDEELTVLFNIALANKSLFTDINCNNDDEYIIKWIDKFIQEKNNPPSGHIAQPKTACSDPAISTIVLHSGICDIDTLSTYESAHNLFMSAENIQGRLLEEYVAFKTKQFGFIWCRGSIFRAIDLCNNSGTCFIQLKNKNNTENSSSSAIRNGTDILKWYRLGTAKKKGKVVPAFKWDSLNELINSNKTSGFDTVCDMSEEDYELFIQKIVMRNPDIISPE